MNRPSEQLDVTSEGLRINALRLCYKSLTVVDGVSLHIDQGEHLAIIGPSGSGKTSLLRCIAGLVRPGHGSIQFHGAFWNREDGQILVPPERRRIGMIAQDLALWPHLTARQHLEVTLKWRGMSRRQRPDEVARLLQLVKLSDRAGHRPGLLSGGEGQRLALARALAGGCRLLLLDEPLGQLDLPLRRSLGVEIHQLTRKLNATLLHVTHDPEDAFRAADRIAVMEAGRISQCGPPDSLRQEPRGEFARAIVESTPQCLRMEYD